MSDFFREAASLRTEPNLIFREVEDRDLIAKARRGDVEAYNLLVSRWEKRVFNYLLRLVSNREDAMDLSQDVFLKAYQNLPKLDDPARVFGLAVPDRAQRGVFAAAPEAAGKRTAGEPRPPGRWRASAAHGTFAGGRKRAQAAE